MKFSPYLYTIKQQQTHNTMNYLVKPTTAQFAHFTGLTEEVSAEIMNDAIDFTIRFGGPNGDFRATTANGYLVLIEVDYTEEETQYTV